MMRPLILLIGAAFAVPGCSGADRAPPPGGGSAAPYTMGYSAPRPGLPAGRGPAYAAPPPSPAVRDRAAVADACRRDADRVVQYRDRGQLMREDDSDARIGTDSSIYARRMETDRLGRVFERDRIAAECLDQSSPAPPVRR
jgi:hypothetical protein